jgi:acyl-CoA dehydrogenase
MDFELPQEHVELRRAVRKLCGDFPDSYWQALEPTTYPQEFVSALSRQGWLSLLIPEEFGGGGSDLLTASIVVEEICSSGASPSACHAQMYVMGTLLRHGTEEQKARYLPEIAAGRLRLQAFGVTEPAAGADTLRLRTQAERVPGGYLVNGHKIWTSRAQYSDLMLLLARTTPVDEITYRMGGLSVFLVDLRDAGDSVRIEPIRTMMNHNTTEVFIEDLRLGEDALIGNEGDGFRYILDGMNAERILIASECVGDGRFFIERGTTYAKDRVVFGRPIGSNQGVQFPLARSHLAVEAASLMRYQAAALYDNGEACGAQANGAKLLASEASWAAANACMDAYGGLGFAVETGIERKFRETRLYQTAPVPNNLVLAYIGQNVLGLPRSY